MRFRHVWSLAAVLLLFASDGAEAGCRRKRAVLFPVRTRAKFIGCYYPGENVKCEMNCRKQGFEHGGLGYNPKCASGAVYRQGCTCWNGPVHP